MKYVSLYITMAFVSRKSQSTIIGIGTQHTRRRSHPRLYRTLLTSNSACTKVDECQITMAWHHPSDAHLRLQRGTTTSSTLLSVQVQFACRCPDGLRSRNRSLVLTRAHACASLSSPISLNRVAHPVAEATRKKLAEERRGRPGQAETMDDRMPSLAVPRSPLSAP